MSSLPTLVGINYYYPEGDNILKRIRFTKIESNATISQLMYQIQKELPHPAPLGLFKVSFEWEDIAVGTAAEPHQLSIVNLLTVLNGDSEPLNPSKYITDVLPYKVITGTHRYTYCSVLVISMDKITFPIVSSPTSLELERLLSDFEISREEFEQVVGSAFTAIDKYNVQHAVRTLGTVKATYNDKLFPATPQSQKPNLLMNHVFNASRHGFRSLDEDFWNTMATNPLHLGVVLGAPGSGKTSALLEYLVDHFGLYFLAKLPEHGSAGRVAMGSDDLLHMYEGVAASMNPKTTVNNDHLLAFAILKIVVGRLILLHKLVTDDETFSPRDWLLLQLYPNHFAPVKDGVKTKHADIFHAIYASIAAGSRDILRSLILHFRRVLYDTLSSRKNFKKELPFLPMVLDEAHHFLPADKALWTFTAWGRTEMPSMPFYTVIVDTLTDPRIDGMLIVAGTGLRLTAPPAVGRSAYCGGVMTTLSTAFRTVEDVNGYLDSLGIQGTSSRVAYWLKGRPSFAASFAEAVLQQPPLDDEIHEVVETDPFGKQSSSKYLLHWDTEEFFFETFLPSMIHSTLRPNSLVPRFERLHISRERNAAELWSRFKRAVHLQMYQSGFYQYEDYKDIELFESGVALISTREISFERRIVIEMSEPLVVWAAIQYMYTEAPDEMSLYIGQRMADAPGPSGQGKIWEQSIPDVLANLFISDGTENNIVWAKPEYKHEYHALIARDSSWRHDCYGIDSEYSNVSFVEWLDNPSISVYFFPENEAGPDAATVTADGILILVQCKLTEPLSPEKTVSRPTAFSTLSSIFPNTFYRPRKDAKKKFGQTVAIGKREIYEKARRFVQTSFKGVIGVVFAYGGLAWPQSVKTPANRTAWISGMEVPYQSILSNGLVGPPVPRRWTEGVDALYVFEGPGELKKLYNEEHLQFLASLKGIGARLK